MCLCSVISVNPGTPASCWRRLLKLQRKKYSHCKDGKPVQGNWSILSETFDDQKQEDERLNCIAGKSSTVNVTQ